MLKKIVLLAIIFVATPPVYSSPKTLFLLYRTNYFTEKTMVYSVDIDENSCQFSSSTKINVFFVKTGTNVQIKEFSNQNKTEFGARSLKVSSDMKSLTFNAKAFDRVAEKLGQAVNLNILALKQNNSCIIKTDFYVGSARFLEDLKRIEVEFNLIKYPLISGLHPDGVTWMGLKGSKKTICLIGACP